MDNLTHAQAWASRRKQAAISAAACSPAAAPMRIWWHNHPPRAPTPRLTSYAAEMSLKRCSASASLFTSGWNLRASWRYELLIVFLSACRRGQARGGGGGEVCTRGRCR